METKKHQFSFVNLGGATRVNIQSGEDIRHLGELDEKMWTVLSCPTVGLEISDKTLQYVDVDKDQKIHVSDVVASAGWLCDVLQNPDVLLENKAELQLSEINQKSEQGGVLYKAAKQILSNLGKADAKSISEDDTADSLKIFAQTRFNGDGIITVKSTDDEDLQTLIAAAVKATGGSQDRSGEQGVDAKQIEAFYTALANYSAWQKAAVKMPFGDDTESVLAAYNALNDKVKDFFLRNRLAQFDEGSRAALDVQVARIEAISAQDLNGQLSDIATYPLARITGKDELDVKAVINPAWKAQMDVILAHGLDKDTKVITEEVWNGIGAKLADYVAWKGSKQGAEVEELGLDSINAILKADRKADLLALIEQDKALETEANNISQVERLVCLHRDFYTLLKNFVTLQDFYSRDKQVWAIFQAGTLIIDQRACRMTMYVSDAGKQAAMAPASGMYLLYCDCTSKNRPGVTRSIVAAMTVGDTGDLMVGKNCIFYDRQGFDWDAVVTKIIDNPISIGQAFWSPYRRLAKWVEDLINKRAAEKDSKMMSDTTAKLQETPAPAADGKPAAAAPFDIAKFAGIFAAIGMAVGMLATALVSVAKGFVSLTWWQMLLVLLAIILLISGPSMVMAWLKLRRRNIAPLLNANGWAVNAASIVNIAFGATLTDIVKFPIIKKKDPYAKKGMSKWLVCLLVVLVLACVGCCLWYFGAFELFR